MDDRETNEKEKREKREHTEINDTHKCMDSKCKLSQISTLKPHINDVP